MRQRDYSSTSRISRNIIAKSLGLFSTLAVGVWLTPYLFASLGAPAFGLVSIGIFISQVIGTVSKCLSSSVVRNATVEARNKNGNMHALLRSSLVLVLLGTLIQCPFVIALVSNINQILDVPGGLLRDTQSFVYLIWLTSNITLFSSILAAIPAIENRLDINEACILARTITRIVFILLLFVWLGPTLSALGIAELIAATVQLVAQLCTTKHCGLGFKLVGDLQGIHHLKSTVVLAWWSFINYVGSLFFIRADTVIINRYISAEDAGRFAALAQLALLIRSLADVLGSTMGPVVMNLYADRNREGLARTVLKSTQIQSCLVAVVCGYLIINAGDIIRIWSKGTLLNGEICLIVLVSHLFINAASTSYFQAQTANQKVKIPALFTIIFGAVAVVISVIYTKYYSGNIVGVALISGSILTVKNICFTPVYIKMILNLKTGEVFAPYVKGLVTLLACSLVAYILKIWLPQGGFIKTLYVLTLYFFASVVVLVLTCSSLAKVASGTLQWAKRIF